MQWYGRPGPREMYSRHAFAPSPLYRYGRLFTLAAYQDRRIIASDAYNGTILWETRLGQLRQRVNIPRDSGYLAVDQDYVYVAASSKCYRVRVNTGRRMRSIELPKHEKDVLHQWGYVGLADGALFGSGVRVGRFYRRGFSAWHDKVTGKICSDFLVAFDTEQQKLMWKYDGVVVNSSITIGGGRIYFVENRQEEVVKGKDRIYSETGDLVIVALDTKKGSKVWETPVTYQAHADVLFGQYQNGRLIMARCRKAGRHNAFQDIAVYDATNGKQRWRKEIHQGHGHHAGHRRKMVVIGDILFQEPNALSLEDGRILWNSGVGRRSCAQLSASARYLFGRRGNHYIFSIRDLAEGKGLEAVEPLTTVTRPGCWINTIPAGGLVLSPEASAGCRCYYPVHASMAFVSSNEKDAATIKASAEEPPIENDDADDGGDE
jgi:outer membrane protein assembly factor BamB